MAKKVFKFKDSNDIDYVLTLDTADLAMIALLKNKKSGAVKPTIISASAAGDIIFVNLKGRHYEVPRKLFFK